VRVFYVFQISYKEFDEIDLDACLQTIKQIDDEDMIDIETSRVDKSKENLVNSLLRQCIFKQKKPGFAEVVKSLGDSIFVGSVSPGFSGVRTVRAYKLEAELKALDLQHLVDLDVALRVI